MAPWTLEHRVFAFETYIETKSIITVQRRFRIHFNVERRGSIPDRNTILRWVEAFRTTGSVMKNKPPGLPRTVRSPENVERVREAVLRSPKRSARRQALALPMSDRSLRRILHKDLKFHPYKIMIVQKLLQGDFAQRRQFCESILEILNEEMVIMMSDEAHFQLDGTVNKQNCRYWSSENPQVLHQRPLHSQKVTVWCGVAKFGIIGPYFLRRTIAQ